MYPYHTSRSPPPFLLAVSSVLARPFFWVVQQHLDCLEHHSDDNGIQLCTTWKYSLLYSYSEYANIDLCKQYVA